MAGKKDTAVRTVRNPGRAKRKLWAYGYAEIASYLGASEVAVRLAVYEGRLDPSSLESLHAAKLRGARALYAPAGCTLENDDGSDKAS